MLKRVVVRCHNRPQERPATLDSVGAEKRRTCARFLTFSYNLGFAGLQGRSEDTAPWTKRVANGISIFTHL